MAWLRITDSFHSNPRVDDAGNAGAGLLVRAASYCAAYGTDGFVRLSWVKTIATPAEIRRVTAAGLWEPAAKGQVFEVRDRRDSGGHRQPDVTVIAPAAGFFIPAYLEYNPSRAEGADLRSKRADAGRKGGQQKASNALALASDPPKQTPRQTTQPVLQHLSSTPVPSPSQEERKAQSSGFGNLEPSALLDQIKAVTA